MLSFLYNSFFFYSIRIRFYFFLLWGVSLFHGWPRNGLKSKWQILLGCWTWSDGRSWVRITHGQLRQAATELCCSVVMKMSCCTSDLKRHVIQPLNLTLDNLLKEKKNWSKDFRQKFKITSLHNSKRILCLWLQALL